VKTPYCAAIGVQRREVDAMRVVIGVEVNRLAEVERRHAKIDVDLRRERSVACSLDVPSTAYFLLMRAEQERLDENRRAISARIDQLRSQAREVYGSLSAVEGAAERYRDEERRRLEGLEQAAMDDRSAAAFLAHSRTARATTTRRSA